MERSTIFMGKFTISMVILSIAILVYQRVNHLDSSNFSKSGDLIQPIGSMVLL